MKTLLRILILVPWLSSCGGNFYKEISSKGTPEALLEDAQNALDDQDYDVAIEKLEEMKVSYSASYLTCETRDGVRNCPRETLAGAYAGRCGFNFLTFVGTISGSSGAVFKFLMNNFTSIAVSPDDCYEAQKVIESIGSPAALSSDQQVFMALLGMAKMGVYLRSDLDTDQDGNGDGAGFSCNTAKISDTHVKQVVTGLGLFLTYSASLSSSGSAIDDLEDISVLCGAACNITDPTNPSLDATVVDSFRDLFESTQYGVGACAVFSPLCCP